MTNEVPPPFSFWDYVHGLAILVLGLIGWIWKDKMSAIKEAIVQQGVRSSEHDKRLQVLETDVARKEDIVGLYNRLEAIQRDNTTQNNAILNTLLTMTHDRR